MGDRPVVSASGYPASGYPLMRDRRLLFAATFLRALVTGMLGVLLGIYLTQRGFNPAEVGLVVSAGLSGAAVATFLATWRGDRVGRRRMLIGVALFGACGAVGVMLASEIAVVLAAAFLGMLNGMGRDRGAAVMIEQAILPATTTDNQRTRAFAWYNVLQDIGHALGGVLAGLPTWLQSGRVMAPLPSMQAVLAIYAVVMVAVASLYVGLSPAVEAAHGKRAMRIAPATRRVLWRLSLLFALDAVAGGFLTSALLAFFFYERFGVSVGALGLLFFGARVANAFSHFGAAWLARRIGLVNTMVFTHVPSSLLLVTVPFAPNFTVAALLFLLREGLVEMDVPTRQSYVMAVVHADERTLASGVTNLVRVAGWAVAPALAGVLMHGGSLAVPLYIAAGMKIAYDALLYAAFRHVKPPEEVRAGLNA